MEVLFQMKWELGLQAWHIGLTLNSWDTDALFLSAYLKNSELVLTAVELECSVQPRQCCGVGLASGCLCDMMLHVHWYKLIVTLRWLERKWPPQAHTSGTIKSCGLVGVMVQGMTQGIDWVQRWRTLLDKVLVKHDQDIQSQECWLLFAL